MVAKMIFQTIGLFPLFLHVKIFEKLFHSGLADFFAAKTFFHEHQFGFRLKHSTEQACVGLLNFVSNALDFQENASCNFFWM